MVQFQARNRNWNEGCLLCIQKSLISEVTRKNWWETEQHEKWLWMGYCHLRKKSIGSGGCYSEIQETSAKRQDLFFVTDFAKQMLVESPVWEITHENIGRLPAIADIHLCQDQFTRWKEPCSLRSLTVMHFLFIKNLFQSWQSN